MGRRQQIERLTALYETGRLVALPEADVEELRQVRNALVRLHSTLDEAVGAWMRAHAPAAALDPPGAEYRLAAARLKRHAEAVGLGVARVVFDGSDCPACAALGNLAPCMACLGAVHPDDPF